MEMSMDSSLNTSQVSFFFLTPLPQSSVIKSFYFPAFVPIEPLICLFANSIELELMLLFEQQME